MSWVLWLLVCVLVIAAIVVKIRRAARIIIFKEPPQQNSYAQDSPRVEGVRTSNVEQMVSCAKCGVYVPASEAIFRTGKVYCCEEHTPHS